MNPIALSEKSPVPDQNRSAMLDAVWPDPVAGEPAMVDSELFIRQAFEKDLEKGYELLFKRYYHPLCSHAVRFVYSKEVAEDLVVDLFTRFWQKKIYLAINTSYRAYLFTSVRHAAFAHLRSEFGREKVPESWHDIESSDTPATPQQLLQYNELYLKIEELISSFPPQSQKVFIMSRFEGKKNVTIAEELQLSVKTVEGHITKALAILRQQLRGYGPLSVLVGTGFFIAYQGYKALFTLLQAAISLEI